MNILFETDKLKLEHEFESIFLVDKTINSILLEDYFYGAPTCGLIDKNNNWAIVAGEHLTIWTAKTWQRIEHKELRWIYSIRVKDSETVEILTDPWSNNSAIWEIDINSFQFNLIKKFEGYKNSEYTENLDW